MSENKIVLVSNMHDREFVVYEKQVDANYWVYTVEYKDNETFYAPFPKRMSCKQVLDALRTKENEFAAQKALDLELKAIVDREKRFLMMREEREAKQIQIKAKEQKERPKKKAIEKIKEHEKFMQIESIKDELISEGISLEFDPQEAGITEREFLTLSSRGSGKTLKETGMIIGVSKERVRQIEAKAFRKLRHPSRESHFKLLAVLYPNYFLGAHKGIDVNLYPDIVEADLCALKGIDLSDIIDKPHN